MFIAELLWRSKRHLRLFSLVSSMKQIFSYLLLFFCQQLFLFSFGNQVVSIRGFILPVLNQLLIGLKWRLGNSGLPRKPSSIWNHFYHFEFVYRSCLKTPFQIFGEGVTKDFLLNYVRDFFEILFYDKSAK